MSCINNARKKFSFCKTTDWLKLDNEEDEEGREAEGVSGIVDVDFALSVGRSVHAVPAPLPGCFALEHPFSGGVTAG